MRDLAADLTAVTGRRVVAAPMPGAVMRATGRVLDRTPIETVLTGEGMTAYTTLPELDDSPVREELGDVLLQVVFHAAIAEGDPEEPFDIDDVAGGLVEKLLHRHPHIFGDEIAETPEQVQANWIRLKGVEKARESVTDGVPLASPALALAAKLAGRARQAGLPLPVTPPAPLYDDEESLGDHLLAEAAAAQSAGIDPEAALRHAARRYRAAMREAETEGRAGRDTPPAEA